MKVINNRPAELKRWFMLPPAVDKMWNTSVNWKWYSILLDPNSICIPTNAYFRIELIKHSHFMAVQFRKCTSRHIWTVIHGFYVYVILYVKSCILKKYYSIKNKSISTTQNKLEYWKHRNSCHTNTLSWVHPLNSPNQ